MNSCCQPIPGLHRVPMDAMDLCVPNVGDARSIELVAWNVAEGDQVAAGDELCELVTDKAAFPLEAPQAGRIVAIKAQQGALVKIGEALLSFEPSSS